MLKKLFDCVEMKRRAQERIYAETKGMKPGELAAYFQRRVLEGPFAELWRKKLCGASRCDQSNIFIWQPKTYRHEDQQSEILFV